MRNFDPLAQNLPCDEMAERFFIATAIDHEKRLQEAVVAVRPEYMAFDSHQIIWGAVCSMYDAGESISGQSVLAHFGTGSGSKDLAHIGGFGYLSEFIAPQVDVSVSEYAAKILDTYGRRMLMFKCNEVMARLVDRTQDLSTIAHDLEEQSRASDAISKQSSGFKNFEDMIRECGGIEAFLSREKGDALSYPWPTLSDMTKGGMKPGQLVVIAGQSGKGKTALVLNIVFRAAYSGQGTPLLFSLEMPKEEIGSRMLALSSSVDSYRFGNLSPEERVRIRDGRSILADHQYLVDDEDAASMAQIKSRVKDMQSRGPVSLVVIDTIQLVDSRKGVRENREQEVARIARDMKRMAMQLKVPVIAVSQVNDIDDGKEPSIKNIRDSRAIWHNANVVMFLHFTQPYDMLAGIPIGELDLILAKHRGGAEGRIKLDFHAPTGRFYER